MSPNELERLVGRALDALPPPRAPRTLLPRVMEATRAMTAAPRSRGWRAWPLVVQATSAILLVAGLAAVAMAAPIARDSLVELWTAATSSVFTAVTEPVTETIAAARRADAALEVIRILWRVVLGPLVAYAAVLFVLMCLVCAAFELSLTWRSRKAHSS